MNDAVKSININFNYSYLIIARKTLLEDNYKEIKEKFSWISRRLNNENCKLFLYF